MIIYLVRHGQTDWNKKVKLQGKSDIPLNEEGRKVAKLTSIGLSDINFTKVISSPLIRAQQTAEIILGERNIEISVDERIIEMSFGDFEGIEFDKTRLEDFGELFNFFKKPHLYQPSNGGETIKQLRERTASFMKELIEDKDLQNDTILVVTHGAAISGLLSYLNNADDEHLWGIGVHKNCAVTKLEVKDGVVNILERNKIYANNIQI